MINKTNVMLPVTFIAVIRLFKCFKTHRNEHISLIQLIYSRDFDRHTSMTYQTSVHQVQSTVASSRTGSYFETRVACVSGMTAESWSTVMPTDVCQTDFRLIDWEEKFLLAKLRGDSHLNYFWDLEFWYKKVVFPLLSRTVNVNKSLFIISSLFSRFCYKEICGLRKNMFRFTNSIFPRYLLQSSNKNLNLIQQSIKLISLNSVQPKIKTNNINIIRAFHIIHRYKIWQ